MKIMGFEITTAQERGCNQFILSTGKEKLVLSIDPKEGNDPGYFILSRVNAQGLLTVVAHGEIDDKQRKKKS